MTNAYPTNTNGAFSSPPPGTTGSTSVRFEYAPPSPFSHHTDLVAQVEAIVRRVLQELLAKPQQPQAAPALSSEHFAGSLFAFRHAEALPPGTRELRLDPATVLTPLARDHLKRLGIAIRIVSGGELALAGAALEWGLAVEPGFPLAHSLKRALLADRDTWFDLGHTVDQAAHWVAAAPHRAAVLITPEAALATYSACQVNGVRAATIADPDAILRAARSLAANLLVIEPANQSIHTIKHLCATYRRVGLPAGSPPSPTQAGRAHP